MNPIFTIFVFKMKQYFGSLRVSKGNLIVALAAIIGPAFFGLTVGIGLPEQPFWTQPTRLVEILATFFSAFLAVSLLFSLRGGVTAFEAELDFVFTSAVKPRHYVLADLLFQFAAIHILFTPIIFFVVGLTLRLSLPVINVIALLAIYELYLLLTLLVMQSVGICRLAISREVANVAIGLLLAILLLPSLRLVTVFPVSYTELPLPSTLAARLFTGLFLEGRVIPLDLLGLIVMVAVVVGAHQGFSARNIFPYMRPTVMMAFAETRFQAEAIKERQMLERIGPLTKFLVLDPTRGSLGGFLFRKHLIRTLRTGSLFVLLLFFVIYAAMGFASTGFALGLSRDSAAAATFSLILYGSLVPAILGMVWNSTDRQNLWIVVTSGKAIVDYFKALFASMLAIALLFALGMLVISVVLSRSPSVWLPLAAIAVSAFAAAFTVLILTLVQVPQEGVPPTAGILLFVAPILAANLAASPFFGLVVLEPSLSVTVQALLIGGVAIYLGAALAGLLKLVERRAIQVRI